jgi:hypothetical protein
MKSPPRPTTRDKMVSEEDMITLFKIEVAGFDLWLNKNSSIGVSVL